ncbi:tetratricopeptide repeat protein [Mesobacillus thioparans]|uniref:tetratricopeptide repeat protein n=1 Tax=Mesobacillus thioparans TaxID=370439 RepID=UPI0039EF1049
MEININVLKSSADKAMKNKEWDQAIEFLTQIMAYQQSFRNEDAFIMQARSLAKQRKLTAAIRHLENGMGLIPSSIKIKLELAALYLLKRKARRLYRVLRLKGSQPALNIYPKLARAHRQLKQHDTANEVLHFGSSLFPNSIGIKVESAELEMAKKNWEAALELWQEVCRTKKKLPANWYLRIAITHQKIDDLAKAEKIIREGLDVHPSKQKLLLKHAELAMEQRHWPEAEKRWKSAFNLHKEDIPENTYVKRAIVNHLLGKHREGKELFDQYFDMEKKSDKEYEKVILFDNGESRIEYYKQMKPTSTVCLSFDSINNIWTEDPFAFKFLLKQGVDIIALRRRTADNYHQDLSIEEYVNTVRELVQPYNRRLAYGFSLGGYTSLYFASSLNCEILSLSPRNSAHPVYGSKKNMAFNHDLSHPINSAISPVIVYDPKDRTDQKYIESELRVSYPNAVFYECRFAGHRTAPYLQQIGKLKILVGAFIMGDELPTIEKHLRWQSHQYVRVLGEHCLSRNKTKWALRLAEHALNVSPDDKKAASLKKKALVKFTESAVATLQANSVD